MDENIKNLVEEVLKECNDPYSAWGRKIDNVHSVGVVEKILIDFNRISDYNSRFSVKRFRDLERKFSGYCKRNINIPFDELERDKQFILFHFRSLTLLP